VQFQEKFYHFQPRNLFFLFFEVWQLTSILEHHHFDRLFVKNHIEKAYKIHIHVFLIGFCIGKQTPELMSVADFFGNEFFRS